MNHLKNLQRVGLILAILSAGLPIIGSAQQDGQRRGPPPEALEACASQSVGAACSFSGPRGEATGACTVIQELDSQLACAPEGGRPRGRESQP